MMFYGGYCLSADLPHYVVPHPDQYPETVDGAVTFLLDVLEPHVKDEVLSVGENDIANFHFGLGMVIRNAFGLHEPGSLLLTATGTAHPDDASDIILLALWKRLRLP
jgi:hypothetical protein